MAELVPIPLGVQQASPRSRALRVESVENLYAEKAPGPEKGQVALIGTPGLRLYRTVGDGPIRGMIQCDNLLYVVSGAYLYTVTSTGTTVELGGIGGSGPVQMAENGSTVVITTSGPAYYANSSVVSLLPESGLNGCTYQDGYALFTQADTENLLWSPVDDLTDINALGTQADALADKVKGLISDHRDVWVFGGTTIEIFANTGASVTPFVRTGGGFVEHGCANGATIAKAENLVFWLGEDGRVYSAQGYAARPISTHAIEYEIGQEDFVSARAYTYSQEGHTFYVLTFTGCTLSFDLSTGLWHKRRSKNLDRWRAECFAKAFSLPLVGDYENGKIYQLDLEYYSEDGDELIRRVICPPMFANGKRILVDELLLDIETGLGLVSGQGDDPIVILDWTHDGARTWSNEHWRSFGAIGEYAKRVHWYTLGSFKKERSLRFTISDPVPVRILGLYGRIEAVES